MAQEPGTLLKTVELRLLRCTLSQAPSPAPPLIHTSLIESLISSIEHGRYADVLSSLQATDSISRFPDFCDFDDSRQGAARFYDEVDKSIEQFLRNAAEDEMEYRFALVMCLAVAAFLAFTQQNVTGPLGNFSSFPVPLRLKKENKAAGSGGEWNAWARAQLTSIGCDLLGKFSLLQYIVYAKIILSKARDLLKEAMDFYRSGSRTTSWWLFRLTLLQQRISDELSSSLYDLLQIFKSETLLQFGNSENVMSYWSSMSNKEEASTIASIAQLEAGILEYKYGRVDSSRIHLDFAEEACGLHLSLTGALGFRTAHQVEPKAQMVLIAKTNQQDSGKESSIESNESQSDDSGGCSHANGHYECCDILMRPRLLKNGNGHEDSGNISDIGKKVALTATQQALILAQCLYLEKRSRDDELSRWEMAPYIEAIHAQPQSYFIIRSFCDLLRIRWESSRSRTKQRALLMMIKLVEGISNEALPGVVERIQFSFVVHAPTIPALRKEYGEILVSCGMIGESLKIFEDLELWNNLIYCYDLLGKKAAAVDLIKARLAEMPTDSRLWCSLGDVTDNDACYEKALEVSNKKSVRAKRSLARSAFKKGDFERSKNFWKAAMMQNSIYPDGWFSLGYAALKDRDYDTALDGFTRVVQLDPENDKAWNNIACVHIVRKKSKEAFVALKEALKFRRTSWELWENYSQVAFEIGNFSQALEAIEKVFKLSPDNHVQVELLDRIMTEVEEKSSMSATSSNDSSCSGTMIENLREVEFMVDMLGNILQQAIRGGGSGDIWGVYARWLKIKGDLTMCSEALVKQVRSYEGSDLCLNPDRFKKFAHASLQLCQVYMEIASSTGSKKELSMAEMHLRNSIKKAVNFPDSKELKELQVCLDEVKRRRSAATPVGV